MKAVNLIPADTPRGGRARVAIGTGGPIGAYVVLAVLAVAVVMAGAWAVTSKQLSGKQSDLVRVEGEAQAAEAKTAALRPYTEFAALRTARVDTVGGLLDGRFDWAHSLREVARVVPSDVDLTSLVGTVSPASKVEGGSTGSLRGALPVPAVDLIGCARTQAHVARLLARLRAIDGVQRVTLASSEKSDAASLSDTDCRSTDKMPQFQVTVFYKALDGIVPATDATAPASSTTAATAASNTAAAGGSK
ncbi:MAG: PilN domain-containing protein [Solirubrobacteraceae bacterium]